jgi:hypothetical protein
MKKLMLVLSLIALVSVGSFAQERTPKVNARQHTQHGRIHQGKNNGELTHREAHLLRQEQKHIRKSERRIKADGDVTARERKRLDRQQDRASRHIRRAKNNELTLN